MRVTNKKEKAILIAEAELRKAKAELRRLQEMEIGLGDESEKLLPFIEDCYGVLAYRVAPEAEDFDYLVKFKSSALARSAKRLVNKSPRSIVADILGVDRNSIYIEQVDEGTWGTEYGINWIDAKFYPESRKETRKKIRESSEAVNSDPASLLKFVVGNLATNYGATYQFLNDDQVEITFDTSTFPEFLADDAENILDEIVHEELAKTGYWLAARSIEAVALEEGFATFIIDVTPCYE